MASRTPWVPAASFILAVALSALGGSSSPPGPRTAATSQDCPCKVAVECNLQVCTYPFDPAISPGLKEKDFKNLGDAAVAHCKNSLPCMEKFDPKWVSGYLADTFKDIQKGNRDADTFTSNAAIDVKVSCVAKAPKMGGDVVIEFCLIALTAFPNGGGQMLRDHEDGHVAIQRHYFCVRMKEYVQKKVQEVVCAKTYSSTDELKVEAGRVANEASKEFQQKVGKHSKFQQDFENATGAGTKGNQGDEVKKVTDDIDAKVKKAFP